MSTKNNPYHQPSIPQHTREQGGKDRDEEESSPDTIEIHLEEYERLKRLAQETSPGTPKAVVSDQSGKKWTSKKASEVGEQTVGNGLPLEHVTSPANEMVSTLDQEQVGVFRQFSFWGAVAAGLLFLLTIIFAIESVISFPAAVVAGVLLIATSIILIRIWNGLRD